MVVGAGIAVAACALPGPAPQSLQGHGPWDVRAQRFVGERDVLDRLVAARYRLLGELHDNPVHHETRARLITAIAATGRTPAVAMEQFALDRDAELQAAQRAGGDAEAVTEAGGLERKAWAWPLHKPIVAAAIAAGLPLRAANLPRSQLRGDLQARIDGAGGEAWIARLRTSPWSAEQAERMREGIEEGHCNQLPAAAVPRIALAQRARDAAMAQAVVDAATRDGTIFIGGNGHVRRDLGIPAYLRPDELARGDVVAVAFVEADDDEARDSDFARRYADEHPGFDVLWFTPPAQRDDPCKQMARPSPAAGGMR